MNKKEKLLWFRFFCCGFNVVVSTITKNGTAEFISRYEEVGAELLECIREQA